MIEPHLHGRTLGEVLRETARRHGARPALLSDAVQWTWSELDAEVDRVAGRLAQEGVGKGDVVATVMTKRAEVVTVFLACARLGALYAPVNFKLTADHLVDQLRTARVRAVVVEERFDDLVDSLGEAVPTRRLSLAQLAEDAGPPPQPLLNPDEPCYLNYTSGTTGRPKGALTSHRNILFQGYTAFDLPGHEGLGFRDDEVFLGMFSVFAHPHELFHRSILCGGAFVIVDSLNPRVIGEAIARFGVTWMMAVPSFYEMLLDSAEAAQLASLRILESGGAFVSAETLARMEERFGAHFMPVWGSTETTGVAIAMRPDRPRRPGATGKPVAGYEVRVVDLQDRDCEAGEDGELVVRGLAVVRGYLNMPEETGRLFHDEWYRTQDVVRWTEDGFIEFVGRRAEMLKIGGIRVYPLEIERVIGQHPDVRGVVVVRAEERIRGEVARAVVQCTPGSSLTVRELQSFCRERLAVYKVPRIVEFWEAIPALPNGKVNKRAVLAVPPDPARDER